VVEDVGERLAGVVLPEPVQLLQRGRVEPAGLDAVDAERFQPPDPAPRRPSP
jgi:hypothetical protein